MSSEAPDGEQEHPLLHPFEHRIPIGELDVIDQRGDVFVSSSESHNRKT